MKNFISVHDVVNAGGNIPAAIDALVEKALAYKANPFKDKSLGAGKRIGMLFLNPSFITLKIVGAAVYCTALVAVV